MGYKKKEHVQNNMKKVLNIFIILLFIAGAGIMLYPIVINQTETLETEQVIEQFESSAATLAKESSGENMEHMRADMADYNEALYQDGQKGLRDPFSYESAAFDLSQYGIVDSIAGYVTIPKIDIKLPIYLGADDENLALGAGNLGYTSVPIGGENTNTVLAAHRGYKGRAMFRDIEALEIGDMVYITNYWETMAYKVSAVKVILPTEIQEIYIQPDKDMLTLVTCHPYTKNYQRYIVFCERTAYQDSNVQQQTGTELINLFHIREMSESQRLIFAEKWSPAAFLAATIILLMFIMRRRHRRKV